MTRRFLLLWLLGWTSELAAGAGPPPGRDLGQGLVYVRVRELPADLPAKPEGKVPASVIDVRYVRAGPEAATAFSAWLKFRATTRSPVFVLANRETSGELRQALRAPHHGSGIVVIGIAHADFEPDVGVRATAEEEKAAYDALGDGIPVASLLKDNPAKERIDEASLARERPASTMGEERPGRKTVPPIIDATLQRAVHLHRSLAALRRS